MRAIGVLSENGIRATKKKIFFAKLYFVGTIYFLIFGSFLKTSGFPGGIYTRRTAQVAEIGFFEKSF
jgi:hypothetical protein